MRVGHQARVAAHQRDAGGLHRHVGAGRHGDADVGRGQRRRVVDAVADHRHHLAGGAQLLHHGRLVGRQHLGAAPRRCRARRATASALPRLSPVSITVSMPSACRRATASRAAGLDGVAEGQQARAASARSPLMRTSQETVRPSRFERARASLRQRARVDAQLVQQPAAAEQQRPGRPRCACTPRPGSAWASAPAARGSRSRAHRVQHGARQRMLAAVLQRGRQAQHVVAALAGGRHARPPATAGLRSACRSCRTPPSSTACASSSASRVLDQDAVARGDAGAGHDRGRRGQAQRAGAGDDQHRDRVDERLLPVARRHAPSREA